MTELFERSAVELAMLVSTGQASAAEVVGAHLARIDETNEAVNAIVSMRPRADIEADAVVADAVAADDRGRLHGLPVAVKDLEDVEGIPTRSGSTITSSRPAGADGLVAARLRAAGAIIIGKTNVPEFGTGSHTYNEVFGVTRNPWNLARSAGGSSGGAAAALASRMLPIADGSDFGGSLRNPAGFCNVVGLRPSIGRVPVPADRSTNLSRLAVQGPMGRTVADTALVLSALAGPDPLDPLSLAGDPAEFAEPLPGASAGADLRVAWGGDLGLFTCEPDVLALCEVATRRFEKADASVSVAHPDLSDSMTVFRTLRGLSYRDLGARIGRERWPALKDTVVANIEYGHTLDVDDVLEAERLRASVHREMTAFFEHYDVLALPSAQVTPFPVEVEFPTDIAGTSMPDYLAWMTTCCVITPTGCPAISIPAGFTSDGLPVGLQLVAPVGHERRLLEVASVLEAVAPFWDEKPPIRQLGDAADC